MLIGCKTRDFGFTMRDLFKTIAADFQIKHLYSTLLFSSAFLIVDIAGLTVLAQQKPPSPPITYENVSYGDHPNQVIDFRKANVDEPAPLIVYIHGGGFKGGSHDKVDGKAIRQYLDAGIHHASVEYRFLKHADISIVPDALAFVEFGCDDCHGSGWWLLDARLLGACRTLNRSEKDSRVNPWVHALFL